MAVDDPNEARFAGLDIGFDPADMQDESDEFLGSVVIDQWEPGRDDSTRWHLGVKPAFIAIKGESGCFHTWANVTKRARSTMGAVRLAFANILTKEEQQAFKIGRGALLGQWYIWTRKDINLGKGRDGEPIVVDGVLIPKRKATAEEIAAGQDATPGVPTASPNGQALPNLDWDDEQIEAMLSVLEGKTPTEMQLEAAKSKLPGALKQAIMNGAALEFLISRGHVEMDEAGKARALSVAEASGASTP